MINILKNILKEKKPQRVISLTEIRTRFDYFFKILEQNNDALKAISNLEEKSGGDYLFDMAFVKNSLAELDVEVKKIVDLLNEMSNNRYPELSEEYKKIHDEIHNSLPGEGKIVEDDAVIPFTELDLDMARQVGSKNANLGELKNCIGMPVPGGFAISAYGYKLFIENNQLQEQILDRLDSLDLKDYDLLQKMSDEIKELILNSRLPEELLQKIGEAVNDLNGADGDTLFSVRSSALGEDTQFSFAGQYESFLNVQIDQIEPCYLQVVASQFSPRALYYYFTQGLKQEEMAMGVACMKMVNALSAGVLYTTNPIDPAQNVVIINSVWGLGKTVVDGMVTPDGFIVDKETKAIHHSRCPEKNIMLTVSDQGGTSIVPVPPDRRKHPSLTEELILRLTELALKIEDHYDEPQDVEWAIDENGDICILQSRPLRVYQPPTDKNKLDLSPYEVLARSGITAAAGVGGGRVFHVDEDRDFYNCPDGAIVVSHSPFPALVFIMNRVNGIITEVGGITGHMATVAREFGIPTLMNVENARALFPEGLKITLDADTQTIYDGIIPELLANGEKEKNLFEDTALFVTLERILKKIVPLHLISPKSPDFLAKNCRTYHDIIRFAHQKALFEMFQTVETSKTDMAMAPTLKTEIPLPIKILFIDEESSHLNVEKEIPDDQIPSLPMQAFWSGVKQAGWPLPPPVTVKGFASVLATSMSTGASARSSFSENSFALLSKEYMNFSIRMGYHYSTIEALCTEQNHKNYIRMRFQEGGASLDRRRRRIRLIINILKTLGFENHSKGDFLDSGISHCGAGPILKNLKWLGALSVFTKQLDMALSTDEITKWYENDILNKLKAL